VVRVLGVLIAAVPFAFASVRLFTTGSDLRYLWMATASAICAAATLLQTGSAQRARFLRTGGAALAAALGAAIVAIAVGATSGIGIAIVAIAFGLCSGVGTGLALRPRGWPAQ